MGCKASTILFPSTAAEFKLKKSGVEKYDQVFTQAEQIVGKVMAAMAKISMAVDRFSAHTGITAGVDYQLCYGILALVCSAIAFSFGDWNDIGLRFSAELPGIYIDTVDKKLREVLGDWDELCQALLEGLDVINMHKFELCEVLKKTRLTPDYMLKDAYDEHTDISTFRAQESAAVENDLAVRRANETFQDLALMIINVVTEATHTIEGLGNASDLSVLRSITRKVEGTRNADPELILSVIYQDLEKLVNQYKEQMGI